MKLRLFVIAGAAAAAASLAGAAAGGGARPSISRALASPALPRAGSGFSVSFHVTRAKSAAFSVILGGKAQRHRDSFRRGIARTAVTLPASAAGKSLRVRLTARSGAGTTTKQATFVVRGAPAPPSLAVSGASAAEGNSGTTPLSFSVTLSRAATRPVSVKYATADKSAIAGSDYTATLGTLTFAPGETTKAIVVSVIGDTMVEPDETFTVTLSDPVGATIATGTATGTISNDDVASPVSSGSYQGATQEANYVFFSVNGSRMVTGFRVNSLTENCNGNAYLKGSVDWGDQAFPIAVDGTFDAEYSWSGSETVGDTEYTAETWKITGRFSTATTENGTISIADEINYQGTHYSCSGSVTYSATFQG
jgi:hypothetical protein